MKRVALYALLGLFAYTIALVWLVPAERWFGLWQAYAPEWTASSLDGNIFAGSIQELQISQRRIGDLRWRWQPSALLRGKLGYRWQLADSASQLEGEVLLGLIAPTSSPIRLARLQGELRLATLIDWLGLSPQAFAALLQADPLTLQVDPAQERLLAADGLIIIKQVRVTGAQPLDLGTFELRLSTEAETIQGFAQDTDSPLELLARLNVQAAENYQINYQIQGEIAARLQADETIRTVIQLLGTAEADGKQSFDFRGRFLL